MFPVVMWQAKSGLHITCRTNAIRLPSPGQSMHLLRVVIVIAARETDMSCPAA